MSLILFSDWEAVLKHDANNTLAKAELAAIPGKAARYEEEQKAEAMSAH